jgi:Holliday junction resolvase RusA-like endonuclease
MSNPTKFPIQIFVSGTPKAQPRPRAFARQFGKKWQARVYDAKTAEGWKSQVAVALKPHIPAIPYDIPLKVTITIWMPRILKHYRTKKGVKVIREDAPNWYTAKPDIDNLAKAAFDAITQCNFWTDDSLVVNGTIRKLYSETPGATIEIEPAV